jgi:hypothetical protein
MTSLIRHSSLNLVKHYEIGQFQRCGDILHRFYFLAPKNINVTPEKAPLARQMFL